MSSTIGSVISKVLWILTSVVFVIAPCSGQTTSTTTVSTADGSTSRTTTDTIAASGIHPANRRNMTTTRTTRHPTTSTTTRPSLAKFSQLERDESFFDASGLINSLYSNPYLYPGNGWNGGYYFNNGYPLSYYPPTPAPSPAPTTQSPGHPTRPHGPHGTASPKPNSHQPHEPQPTAAPKHSQPLIKHGNPAKVTPSLPVTVGVGAKLRPPPGKLTPVAPVKDKSAINVVPAKDSSAVVPPKHHIIPVPVVHHSAPAVRYHYSAPAARPAPHFQPSSYRAVVYRSAPASHSYYRGGGRG